MKRLFQGLWRHKIFTAVLIATLIVGGYFLYIHFNQSEVAVSYQTDLVRSGNIKKIVSTTGQVSAIKQVNVSAKVAGEITRIDIEENQEIQAGQALFQLDTTDINRQITDAQLDVDKAELSLEQTKAGADESQLFKAYNDLQQAKDDLTQLKLRLEQQMESAVASKVAAEKKMAELAEGTPDYEKYATQRDTAANTIEELQISIPIQIHQAENNITLKQNALNDLRAGPDDLDVRTQEMALEKAQNQLDQLLEQKADYTIKANFDGLITDINAEVGDTVTAGSSGSASNSSTNALAILLTNDKKATVVVNEVDVPELAVGQEAEVTFDAIPDLTIKGQVAKIDKIGTVEQGVVSHNVDITFLDQDDRINISMTANVEIITASAENVLIISSSAIKKSGSKYFVDKYVGDTIESVEVKTGLTDGINTEITSGLNQGDEVVTKEITATSNSNSSSGSSSGPSDTFFQMGPGAR